MSNEAGKKEARLAAESMRKACENAGIDYLIFGPKKEEKEE